MRGLYFSKDERVDKKRGLASSLTSPLESFILLLVLKNLFPNMISLISGTN